MVFVLRQNWEFLFLLTHHQRQNCCHGNSTKGVILFLLWCTFMMPSLKNTASIFPEISFIQYFRLFSCKQYDVITDLICIIEKSQYLYISKRKTPFFCILKGLSNKHNFFSFHRHFNKIGIGWHWPCKMTFCELLICIEIMPLLLWTVICYCTTSREVQFGPIYLLRIAIILKIVGSSF